MLKAKKVKPKLSKKNDIVVKRPPVIYHPPPEIYHRPPIIVHRPPLVIRRPPIIYHQPPVIVHRPAVVYHQPPLVFHQPPPAVSQPILKSHDTFMMHPAAHLSHMGSMVTNAGTYVGVPEHRFMYQGGMGFFHAGEHYDHGAVAPAYGPSVMPPMHGPSPVLANSRDTMEGGTEAASPEEQDVGQAPMETVEGPAQEEGAPAMPGQEYPEQEQGMVKASTDSKEGNVAKVTKRKFINRLTQVKSSVRRARRQIQQFEQPDQYTGYRHSEVPYDFEPYPNTRRHRKTTVNVDVVGKRSIKDVNNNEEPFLF